MIFDKKLLNHQMAVAYFGIPQSRVSSLYGADCCRCHDEKCDPKTLSQSPPHWESWGENIATMAKWPPENVENNPYI